MRILRIAAVLTGAVLSFSSAAMAAERGVVPLNEFIASVTGAQSVPKAKGAAAAGWIKAASFNLFEYNGYPRRGTYDLWYNTQLAPYGYQYYVVVNIGPVCDHRTRFIHGGLERGWMTGFTVDPAFLQRNDPYANGAIRVDFDAALRDSSGTTLECDGTTSPDQGFHWFFMYPPQNRYRDLLGLEWGDLLICETNRWGSGCNWYHVYQ